MRWESALHFLLTLESTHSEVKWLPAYLVESGKPQANTATAAARLIHLCLTNFAPLEGERVVLLHSFAARRLAKQMMSMTPPMAELGQMLHLLVRNQVDEKAFIQQTSSPEGNLLHFLDELQVMASQKFVTDNRLPNGQFDTGKAKLELREAWRRERSRLGDGNLYREACHALRLDQEIASTEALAVIYDQLGHLTLCVVNRFPKWKAHALANHKSEIERLARFGSWMAREWLGLSLDAPRPRSTLKEVADQFFYADVDTCSALAKGYGYLDEMEDSITSA